MTAWNRRDLLVREQAGDLGQPYGEGLRADAHGEKVFLECRVEAYRFDKGAVEGKPVNAFIDEALLPTVTDGPGGIFITKENADKITPNY